MKNFSNKIERKKYNNAVIKVILKRYSFIVWLPFLLAVLNYIGRFIIKLKIFVLKTNFVINIFIGIATIIISLFMIIAILILFFYILLVLSCSMSIIESIYKFLKSKTLKQHIVGFISIVVKFISCFFVKIPRNIFTRIKDEKIRFNESVEKEFNKSNEKVIKEEIDY